MTHPSVQRNYQPTSPYYTELPTPATTSSRQTQQQQLQSSQNLPGAFPNTRNVYPPPTSTDATSLPQYQLNPHQLPNTHAHVPHAQSPTSPPLTPFMPDMNGTKVPGPRQEIKGVLRKERYEYKAPWPVYGLDWSKRPGDKSFRLAIGSFIEENINKLQIITLSEFAYDDPYHRNPNVDLVKIAETDHRYPITKVLWEPFKGGLKTPDLLATAGDYLRLWEVEDDFNNTSNTIGANNYTGVRQQRLNHKSMLTNTKADFNAPLTSFDWNEIDPTLAVTSSIDTTCTVWNVETKQAKTQLIAHDKEVYDVAFASGTVDVFASVGADGSVRMFDLRNLEHSTIIYETVNPHPTSMNATNPVPPSPLLRLCFNKMEPNYLATFHMDSLDVQILDVRVPGVPVAELRGHSATVNCVSWAPNHTGILCSGGDDSQVLVWNINGVQMGGVGAKPYNNDPILSYKADNEISQLSWSSRYPDWVAIGFGNTVQALRM
ncbi:1583_t:CDS:2 [Gigaspora margarita]|uniref:1583_t:CDS:1 n=2 Tax=Gigaspora margarita TaxID=4874 RepID=A0ABN7UYX0_GIGMA|nr:WD40 repeat-like protein [Gigaspora margarita]CAG8696779.1 1583_t:CDS:2 [Gigaspora margarita]